MVAPYGALTESKLAVQLGMRPTKSQCWEPGIYENFVYCKFCKLQILKKKDVILDHIDSESHYIAHREYLDSLKTGHERRIIKWMKRK